MRTIYKYPIDLMSDHNLITGYFLDILTAQMQGNQAVVWIEIDPEEYNKTMYAAVFGNEPATIDIVVYGTGWPVQEKFKDLNYINTIQLKDGTVWHLFWKFVD